MFWIRKSRNVQSELKSWNRDNQGWNQNRGNTTNKKNWDSTTEYPFSDYIRFSPHNVRQSITALGMSVYLTGRQCDDTSPSR